MALTPEKYQKIKAALASNEMDFSDEMRAELQAAVDAYSNDYSARAQGTQKPHDQLADNPLAMPVSADEAPLLSVSAAPKERSVPSAPQPAVQPDEAKVQQLLGQLDPSLSLPAQVLALQPATTHPAGDEAAAEEWIRGDLGNPNGLVVAYDLPVAEVRKRLLAEPQLFRALQLSVPPTPEGVMSIETGDTVHQAFNDYYFSQAADAAAQAGKTIYRYSKAPFLGEGKGASILDTLKTKVNTMPGDGAEAFILGYDDAARFGAGRALQESGIGGPNAGPRDVEHERDVQRKMPFEKVGGIPDDATAQERNDMLAEDKTLVHTAGQIVGTLNPLTVAGKLWARVVGGEAAKTALRGAMSTGARMAAAGGADQAAREGVQAASSYAATGDTGTTLEEAGGRVAQASGASGVLGLLGGGVRGLGNQVTEGVEWGERYGGAPGRVKAHGVKTKLFKGHEAPPVVQEATQRGRAEGGRDALTVLASDLDEPLGGVARGRVASAKQAEADTIAAHRASPEGGYTLPAGNLVEAAAMKLRGLMSDVPRKGLRGVGKPRVESPVRDILNANIEGVSHRPGKHSVSITVEEARAFLAPEWLKKLDLDAPDGSAGPQGRLKAANDNGGRRARSRPPGAEDDPVYLTPRRYDSEHFDEVIEQLRKSQDDHVQEVYRAARDDRAARGTGEYAAARDRHEKSVTAAEAEAKRIGANRPRGVRKTVEAVGKSKGQHEATPALREAARAAGGDAPEKLRGALVADDLVDLRNWSTLGGRNPLASPWSLWGMADKTILKGAYPAAVQLEKVKPGAAAAAGRAATNAMGDRSDERREKRDEKNAEGYRERAKAAGSDKRSPRGERKVKPRQRAGERASAR